MAEGGGRRGGTDFSSLRRGGGPLLVSCKDKPNWLYNTQYGWASSTWDEKG
jgi:hypothetical protein